MAIALHEVDYTPDTQASSERNNERLEHTDCRCKKFHNSIPPSKFPEKQKKRGVQLFVLNSPLSSFLIRLFLLP
jgi:hypothetical protein